MYKTGTGPVLVDLHSGEYVQDALKKYREDGIADQGKLGLKGQAGLIGVDQRMAVQTEGLSDSGCKVLHSPFGLLE